MAKVVNQRDTLEVAMNEEFSAIIKYRYHGDGNHHQEGHNVCTIGISDRKYAMGKNALSRVTKNLQAKLVMYDVASRSVVGFFESTGPCYRSDAVVFSPDIRREGERWAVRVDGMSYCRKDRAIPIARLQEQFPNLKIVKGGFQYCGHEVFDWVKNQMGG